MDKIGLSVKIFALLCVLSQALAGTVNLQETLESGEVSLNKSDTLLQTDDFLIEGDTDYMSEYEDDGLTDEEAEAEDTAFEEAIAVDTELEEHSDWEATQNETLDDESRDILNTRVINGQSVSITHFPWQVSFQRNKKHICGGSIVAPNIILTAAHCIDKPGALSSYRVRVGSSYHNRGGALVSVRKLIRQENFIPKILDNDVAIVVLKTRLRFNKNVRPVRVAKQGDAVPAKRRLFVSGWGYTSQGASGLPTTLQYVAVRLLDEDACQKSYRPVTRITNRMFCAGAAKGGKDSCQGDSGGPLVSYIRGSPKLFGVVSWGVGCAQKGFPGVYTKVSAMRLWINKKIAQLRKTKGRP